MKLLALLVVGAVVVLAMAPTARADTPPTLVECPDHTHVWDETQCDDGNPFGLPSAGHGRGGNGGLLGLIGRLL